MNGKHQTEQVDPARLSFPVSTLYPIPLWKGYSASLGRSEERRIGGSKDWGEHPPAEHESNRPGKHLC